MQAHNLLANGMGGIDWAGLPIVAAYLGITRVDLLLQSLQVIKSHRPPRQDDDAAPAHDPLNIPKS